MQKHAVIILEQEINSMFDLMSKKWGNMNFFTKSEFCENDQKGIFPHITTILLGDNATML